MGEEEKPAEKTVRTRKRKHPRGLDGPHLQRKMAETAEKRRQALALRKQGLTYEQIARAMGLSTKMVAWRYVEEAIKEIPRENAIAVKALATQKLDAQEARLNTLLAAADAADPKKKRSLSVAELVRIELALVRVAERRARLEGHDAPLRTELTGKDGAPLTLSVHDLEGMSDDQLDRVIRSALRSGASRGGSGPEEEEDGVSASAPRGSH